jgi:hypothetical protein
MIYVIDRKGFVFMKNRVTAELLQFFPHVYNHILMVHLLLEGKAKYCVLSCISSTIFSPTMCRILLPFFFSGEGPRSRRYGRTAAVRLLVQPCDEDDDDDDYFLSLS